MHGIERSVIVRVEPTVTEAADVIWDMHAQDQITLLSCIDTRFFRIPADGETQLAHMLGALRKQPPEKQKRVKHIVKALYKFLVEEDNSEIEEDVK